MKKELYSEDKTIKAMIERLKDIQTGNKNRLLWKNTIKYLEYKK